LTLFWNIGRLLGFILVIQIFTGLFLVFFYIPSGSYSFFRVNYLIREVSFGWLLRILHFNGASLFFFFLFAHFFKGLFFSSFRLKEVWGSGITILLFIIAEAFIGYVLVWAQISYWARVVITSLLSVIPFFGDIIVSFIWGGFIVSGATLSFFFTLHFLIPWILLVVVFFHIVFLHYSGSSRSLGDFSLYSKLSFFPYYWGKDSYNLFILIIFIFLSLVYPFNLGDPEIFLEANSMVRPVHIIPEWYFLFAYAILRAIPNKLLGVISLLLRILFYYFFIFCNNYYFQFDLIHKTIVFTLFLVLFLLTWLGQCLVEFPFVYLAIVISCFYFGLLVIIILFYNFVGMLVKF